MMKWLTISLTVLGLSACGGSESVDVASWPAFSAAYRETQGDLSWDLRVSYDGPDSWRVETTRPNSRAALTTYDGRAARSFALDGTLILEERGEYAPSLTYPWGYPPGSVKQLVAYDDRWEIQVDGSIKKTERFEEDCGPGSYTGCKPFVEEELFVRDAAGIPVTYERRMDGELIHTVERLSLETRSTGSE
jgi:hypothetical protein